MRESTYRSARSSFKSARQAGQSPFFSEDCAKWGQSPAVLKLLLSISTHSCGYAPVAACRWKNARPPLGPGKHDDRPSRSYRPARIPDSRLFRLSTGRPAAVRRSGSPTKAAPAARSRPKCRTNESCSSASRFKTNGVPSASHSAKPAVFAQGHRNHRRLEAGLHDPTGQHAVFFVTPAGGQHKQSAGQSPQDGGKLSRTQCAIPSDA